MTKGVELLLVPWDHDFASMEYNPLHPYTPYTPYIHYTPLAPTTSPLWSAALTPLYTRTPLTSLTPP